MKTSPTWARHLWRSGRADVPLADARLDEERDGLHQAAQNLAVESDGVLAPRQLHLVVGGGTASCVFLFRFLSQRPNEI